MCAERGRDGEADEEHLADDYPSRMRRRHGQEWLIPPRDHHETHERRVEGGRGCKKKAKSDERSLADTPPRTGTFRPRLRMPYPHRCPGEQGGGECQFDHSGKIALRQQAAPVDLGEPLANGERKNCSERSGPNDDCEREGNHRAGRGTPRQSRNRDQRSGRIEARQSEAHGGGEE